MSLSDNYSLQILITQDLGQPIKSTSKGDMWRCPFHNDNDPSLIAFEDGYYHCFGCGAHGDAVDWLRNYRGTSWQQIVGDTPPQAAPAVSRKQSVSLLIKQQKTMDEQQRVRDGLHASGLVEIYHQNMTPERRRLWYQRGVDDFFIDALMLGFDPRRNALSIPFWGLGKTVEAMKFRHLSGKVRYTSLPGTGARLFRPNLSALRQRPNVILIEGEIKALVTFKMVFEHIDPNRVKRLGRDGALQLARYEIIGIPGAAFSDWKQLAGFEKAWVILDPDATERAYEIANQLGPERCRIVDNLPDKIDDMIIAGELTTKGLWASLCQAKQI